MRQILCGMLIACRFIAVAAAEEGPGAAKPEVRRPTILWTVPLKSDSKGSAAVADIDGDGKLEIVFGTYFNDRHVYALSAEDGRVQWKFLSDRGPLDASIAIADLDHDDKLETLTADSSSGNLFCLDGHGKEKWRLKLPNSTDSPPAIADLDGDGRLEIVVATCDGDVYALNAAGEQVWHRHFDGEYLFAPTTIVDVAGDGDERIVVGGRNHLYLLQASDGELIWKKKVDSHVERGAAAADVDGDGDLDVIFCAGTRLFVLDGRSGEELLAFEAGDEKMPDPAARISSAPVVADFDGDGGLDVFFVVGKGLYGQDGKLMKENHGRGVALRLGGKGDGWPTFRGNLHRTGRASP